MNTQAPKVRGRSAAPAKRKVAFETSTILFADQVIDPTKLNLVVGDLGPLSVFVRGTVSLDKEAAKKAFAEIFDGIQMTVKQLLFMEQLVEFICTNGVMSPHSLFEPPFTYLHDQSVDVIFPTQATQIVKIITQINGNAEPI